MRSSLKLLVCALSAGVFSTPSIANNSPYDFSYRVAVQGSEELRPSMVFNDGKDTYVEIDEKVSIGTGDKTTVLRSGPYYVVRGLNEVITLTSGSSKTTIYYEPQQSPSITKSHVIDPATIAPQPRMQPSYPVTTTPQLTHQ